jgi:stage II sporulation protein B
MNKARITYRFDHNRRSSKVNRENEHDSGKVIPLNQNDFHVTDEDVEEAHSVENTGRPRKIYDTQSLNQFTTDFGAWNSPFETESDELEHIIRSTDSRKEAEAHHEKKEHTAANERHYNSETGYYGAPYIPDGGKYDEKIIRPRYVRRSGAPWAKILTSMSGAVITGLMFGYFVLSLFTGNNQPIDEQLNNANLAGSPGATEPQNITGTNNSPSAAAISDNIQLDLEAQNYHVVQIGVFGQTEGVERTKADLERKGYAFAVESSENYRVYAGITKNRDFALGLSKKMEEEGFEKPIIKDLQLASLEYLVWNGAVEPVQSYLSEGRKLVGRISELTTEKLSASNPPAIDSAVLNEIKASHQQWGRLAGNVATGNDSQLKSKLQGMDREMNVAMNSLTEYSKKPQPAYLWQAQSALMKYVLLEKEILASVGQ